MRLLPNPLQKQFQPPSRETYCCPKFIETIHLPADLATLPLRNVVLPNLAQTIYNFLPAGVLWFLSSEIKAAVCSFVASDQMPSQHVLCLVVLSPTHPPPMIRHLVSRFVITHTIKGCTYKGK